MRLITWNLNYRRDVAGQVRAAMAHSPDIVVFQEVRAASFEALQEGLAAEGLGWFATSRDGVAGMPSLNRFVIAASNAPLFPALPAAAPAAEATLCLEVQAPGGPFELVGVYVPTIARPDGVKVPTQLAIHERLRDATQRPHVLCGDFNSPKSESADGVVTLFSRPNRPAEFAGEDALMGGLAKFGMRDAFRDCNGFEPDDRSWYWKNRGRTGGYRLDHVFVSRHFRVANCWYDHSVRERGLSDHSLLAGEVELVSEGESASHA